MSLDNKNIKNIAKLARLAIDENEIPQYQENLSQILSLVETMKSVDTTSLKPLAHPLEIHARLRQDKVTEENQRDAFQTIAPEVEEGHYLVPKVID